MIDPWFSQEAARWLAFLSLFSLASVLAPFVRQGRHRVFVMSTFWACAILGLLLLIAALIAVWLDQPRYVVFPLAVSGIVMSVVFVSMLWMVPREYTKVELRRMAAGDI